MDHRLVWELVTFADAEIAAMLGCTKRVVLRALHAYALPVRRSGPIRPDDDPRPLLDVLYSDPKIKAALTRHRIPSRPEPGRLRARWPEPADMSAAALRTFYVDLGLSCHKISLLTGIHEPGVRSRLQQSGIPTRSL